MVLLGRTHHRDRGLDDQVSESALPLLHPPVPSRSNMASYLPAPSVDAKGRQEGVEDHVTGLYVDW